MNTMKKSRLLLLITLMCVTSVAAQQSFDFAKNQIKVWELARSRTIEVANAMPEGSYNYSPVAGVMSFGQQMTHMANSLLSMHTRFIKGARYQGREKDASKMNKQQIIQALDQAFTTVIEDMQTLSDADLKATGKMHGAFPLTKWQSLLFMRDHITNHRAKAVVYLRLNNIMPPAYGFN
ncbi:DinB family protein [Robertkochia sediminum]|uniref:DinB family protein n=1 Tax=Robertkochia sediminum TaxID=2785326 RepID=UPI0019333B2D|nr:DinB family protein [Robertkochia sediminum]MBL7472039.1 DinB family protein [Robertkochia sediminum]